MVILPLRFNRQSQEKERQKSRRNKKVVKMNSP